MFSIRYKLELPYCSLKLIEIIVPFTRNSCGSLKHIHKQREVCEQSATILKSISNCADS